MNRKVIHLFFSLAFVICIVSPLNALAFSIPDSSLDSYRVTKDEIVEVVKKTASAARCAIDPIFVYFGKGSVDCRNISAL